MEDEKSFRERLGNDLKNLKRTIIKEEAKSALMAICFGANAVCIALMPFTVFTLLNIAAAYFILKQFKPTVKKQIMYRAHLDFLKTIKKDKVWTQGDK